MRMGAHVLWGARKLVQRIALFLRRLVGYECLTNINRMKNFMAR